MNDVKMSGRLGREIELKSTASGKEVTNFSIAVYGGKDSSGNAISEWYEWQAWEQTARRVSRANVGDILVLNGNAKVNEYEKDGQTIKKVIFVAREAYIEPKRNTNDGEEYEF